MAKKAKTTVTLGLAGTMRTVRQPSRRELRKHENELDCKSGTNGVECISSARGKHRVEDANSTDDATGDDGTDYDKNANDAAGRATCMGGPEERRSVGVCAFCAENNDVSNDGSGDNEADREDSAKIGDRCGLRL